MMKISKMPIKTLFVIALFGAPTLAFCADWKLFFQENDGTDHYMDMSRIKVTKHMVTAWFKNDYPVINVITDPPSHYDSSVNKIEVDCQNNRLRFLSIAFYLGNELAHERPSGARPWDQVIPGSIGQMMYKLACSQVLTK